MLKIILLFFALHLQTHYAFSADIYAAKPNSKKHESGGNYKCGDLIIHITGTISNGDASKLRIVMRKLMAEFGEESCRGASMIIYLDSEGGNIDQAIELGRFIRENELSTHVNIFTKCYSSCPLIFAGGVTRTAFENIGIHRPYFYDLKDKLTSLQVRQEIDLLNKKIESYLLEMDISKNLLDAMLSIPPSEIKILSETELKSYRLTGEDMAYNERGVSKQAKIYNISSYEYRKRDAEGMALCKISRPRYDGDYDTDCWSSYMLRITVAEYKKRMLKKDFVCENKKISKQERVSCIKNIVVLGR